MSLVVITEFNLQYSLGEVRLKAPCLCATCSTFSNILELHALIDNSNLWSQLQVLHNSLITGCSLSPSPELAGSRCYFASWVHQFILTNQQRLVFGSAFCLTVDSVIIVACVSACHQPGAKTTNPAFNNKEQMIQFQCRSGSLLIK